MYIFIPKIFITYHERSKCYYDTLFASKIYNYPPNRKKESIRKYYYLEKAVPSFMNYTTINVPCSNLLGY
jgi:hypothetical protein